MGRLIGYEFRKAFLNKRMLIALVITIALVIYTNWDIVIQGTSGYAKAYREAYQRYEGQLVTKAFLVQVQNDYQQLLHVKRSDALGNTLPDSVYKAWEDVYRYEIANMITAERADELQAKRRQWLKDGVTDTGMPLTENDRIAYQRLLAMPSGDVVHCVVGWRALYEKIYRVIDDNVPRIGGAQGYMLILLLIFGLSTIFSSEYDRQTISTLLTMKRRSQMVWAKVITGLAMAGIFFVATFGVKFLIVACVYGLDGFFAPALQLSSNMIANIPFPNAVVGVNVMFDGLMLLLSLLSSALLIMALSASFRNSLPVLGLAIFIFIGQLLFTVMFSTSGTNAPYFLTPIRRLRDLDAYYDLKYAVDIPVRIIMDSFSSFHPIYSYTIYTLNNLMEQYIFIIVFNSVISLACLAWIPWIFQRRQGPLWNRRIEKA